MLPTPTLNSWFELLRLQHPWSHSLAQRLPRWWVEPHGAAQCSGRGRCSSQEWTVRVAFQLLDDLRRHLRVSGEHHGQTICPTCPVRRDTCPCGAPEAHSAQHQREIRTTPDIFFLRDVDVQEGAHASPNTFVMCPGIRRHRLGLHHTKEIIRSCRGAMQQDQPADCRSVTMGIRSNSVRCSAAFFSRCAWMKAGSPRGVPNTTIPCCDGGKSVSPDPRQTRAVGSAACAILSNASHPSGLIPLRFQTCVLPPWTRIRAWENKLRCRDPYA